MLPLDVNSLLLDWPRWCDQFQIFVAAKHDNQLVNAEKLSIFLECLGTEGSTLATSLLPEQTDEDGTADLDTFDEVWWRMNDIAQDVYLDRRRTREISKKRRQLLQKDIQLVREHL